MSKVAPLSESEAIEMTTWRYEGIYQVYNLPSWEECMGKDLALTDRKTRETEFFSFREGNLFLGFFRLSPKHDHVVLSVGMKPEECGRKRGHSLLLAAMEKSQELYPFSPLRLYVRPFNMRAIRCYEGVGFRICSGKVATVDGVRTQFYEMERGPFLEKRTAEVELTNVCLIYTNDKILVEEKKGTGYDKGLVLPGGHVEENESLTDAVIREMKEETGLTIRHPRPCGHKDWIMDGGKRYLVLLYKTEEFEGELKSSEEGKVFWLDRKDIPEANFIWSMREVLEIMEQGEYSEHFSVRNEEGEYEGSLLG